MAIISTRLLLSPKVLSSVFVVFGGVVVVPRGQDCGGVPTFFFFFHWGGWNWKWDRAWPSGTEVELLLVPSAGQKGDQFSVGFPWRDMK